MRIRLGLDYLKVKKCIISPGRLLTVYELCGGFCCREAHAGS